MSSDNATVIPSVMLIAESWVRQLGGISYAFLAAASLCGYAVLALVLFRRHRYYKRSAFFVITWQLICCDVVSQMLQLILAVPVTLTASDVYGGTAISYILPLADTTSYYGTVTFSLLMTLNRAAVFFKPSVNNRLFEAPNIYATLAVSWFVSTIPPLTVTLAGCHKTFTTNGVYAYTDCGAARAKATWTFWYYVKTYCPVMMMGIYVAIFAYLRFLAGKASKRTAPFNSQKDGHTRRRETKLLLQSFLICATLEVENLASANVQYIHVEGQWTFVKFFLQNWMKIANGSMTAIILFIFNAEIRSQILRILRIRHGSSGASVSIVTSPIFQKTHATSKASTL